MEITELKSQNRELIKSEMTMKSEINKLNNTIFNLNSEIQSTRSILRKTEDAHAATAKLLDKTVTYQSPHILDEESA